jgi:large subunit ribosomal protein L13
MDHTIDAKDKRLGRVAAQIAILLQGKDSPAYNPRLPGKGRVIVKNAGKLAVSQKKLESKIYYRHTGYMGHLREKTLKERFASSPEKVLFDTVYNMLPKNRLRTPRLKRLVIER